MSTYKSDIESYSASIKSISSTAHTNETTLNAELKPELATLRLELRRVEDEWSTLDARHSAELDSKRGGFEREEVELRERLKELDEAATRQRAEWVEKKQRASEEFKVSKPADFFILSVYLSLITLYTHQVEYSSIESKISRLLRKKEGVIADLNEELAELQGGNAEMQLEIERLRHSRHKEDGDDDDEAR